jgi:hypothetical protein
MKEFTTTRVASFAAAIATCLAIASVAGMAAAESAA